MNARDAILAAIRSAAVPASPALPPRQGQATESDLLEQFLRVLGDVGGHGIVLGSHQSVNDAIGDIRAALGGDTPDDLLVIAGRFGVAENGAVYVDSADLGHRADIVRAEHLVVTVARDAIVPTMHEAVRLMPRDSACGWFLSGPSKTADIEQALVIGAQGARTLHVLIDPA